MSRALKILEMVTTLGRDRVCEACGSEFKCGASLNGCWCSEIQLSDEVRTYLRSQYSDCLCQGCLETAARGEELGAKSEGPRAKGEELRAKSYRLALRP